MRQYSPGAFFSRAKTAILASLVLLVLAPVLYFNGTPTSSDSLPINGDDAIAQLQAEGTYDSLAAAMTAAQYRVEADGEHLAAENPAQKLAAKFETDGALSIANAEHSTVFRVASFGRGDDQWQVGAGRWTATESRAENRRADIGLTEYVENRPDGIEQGFIIDEKPAGTAPLSLILKTDGGLNVTASADGQRVILKNDAGTEVLAYEKLRVWDANNLELTARMSTTNDAIKLEVEDAAAVYPLTIDPTFVQTKKLAADDGDAKDHFGRSVAISNDTVVVGSQDAEIGNNFSQGAAYVFVRTGQVWTQQAKLVAPDGEESDAFGEVVAISGDTIVVGTPLDDDNAGQGSVYVFVRNGNVWQAQSKLFPADGALMDRFGRSVAVSGETLVVGAPRAGVGTNARAGAAYVYVRGGGVWTLQRKLTASDAGAFAEFGTSVALAGNTIIAGSPKDQVVANVSQGSAYVFSRSGTIWTQQTKLVANDGASNDFFGQEVDLANTFSGVVVVVGAQECDIAGVLNAGAVYVFERSQIGIWSQTQKIFPDVLGGEERRFGSYVKINPFGNAIAIGELAFGSINIYGQSNSGWTRRQKLWLADDKSTGRADSFDLTSDTLVAGYSGADVGGRVNQGAAFIFTHGQKPFDFDGDGKTDLSIYRPNGSQWWFNRSSDLVTNVFNLGTGSDRLVPGDYTGDGKTDVAMWRPSTGVWSIVRSEDNSFFSFPFGALGDVPVPADYDGDGKTDPAVFRNGTWYISNSSGIGTTIVNFGLFNDFPVSADFDGDLKADIAVFRPADGSWWYLQSSNGQFKVFSFGLGTDKPVQGDWTGDGKADIAVFRRATGTWYVQRSEDNSYFSFPFGAIGDMPAPGDYDGDGRFDAAVFRPSTATWYAQTVTAGTIIAQFGATGDFPLPNVFVP